MSDAGTLSDPTPAVLARVRESFGERFVPGRLEAERAAVALLDRRAGKLDRDEIAQLIQLFNTHEAAGRVRRDRFSPGFTGATMQKLAQDLDRFNEAVAELWTEPLDTALDVLGRIYADRSLLPGAGPSLPSMVLYLRDSERFGVCINATMRGLAEALGTAAFKASSRAEYERFCQSLRGWRERHGIAPQEVDAVLTQLWRDIRGERQSIPTATGFGDLPSRFLADLAVHNNHAWMEANRDRYHSELRQPLVSLLEQIAARHLRELDPQLDTVVKTARVLASIRKRFPDEHGEYYEYFWGAFSRGRKQEDVQLAVLVEAAALNASLYFASARPEQVRRLRQALEERGDELLAPVLAFRRQLVWEVGGKRENPVEGPQRSVSATDAASAVEWLDEVGTSLKWRIPVGDPLLDDPHLADEIGAFFRAVHPLAAAAWGDPIVGAVASGGADDIEGVQDDAHRRATIEEVAERCYLPPETIDEWVSALNGTMRQGLFYGPPGTGKTFVATELARHLATTPEHIELVQFHPAYSYEDFIEGLRPQITEDGALRYDIRDGLFKDFCARARVAGNDTFVLIIDEMNRADLAAVFGELLMLLEYRGDRSVVLPYSQRRFTVPRNMIVLGTMNTADRSLALVDFALRRRFNAFQLDPSRDVVAGWAKEHPDADGELIVALFDLILDRVGGDNPVAPGHSYWMVDGADAAIVGRIWSYQVRPYLAEHWFERPEELAQLDQDVLALIAEKS